MTDFNELLKSMVDPIIAESIKRNLQNELHGSNVETFPEFMTQDQASKYLCISKSALYSMTSKNEIPYYKNGKRNLFKRSDLRNKIESRRIRPLSEIREEVG